MKLFQQLLVAPAAVGFLASGASAADLNINGVSDYADDAVDGLEQVTSITQFSDVYPTDWAYQALSNLIERYGCVAGYPNGTFRGNRAMTRYEAAALLNACLDRITEITDELRRLIKEFETELAIIRGRVDGLEARVGELEATQFSTTTKLKGQADFFMGAVTYEDRDKCNKKAAKGKTYNGTDCTSDAFNFTYRLTLNLNTTFTGKDRLYTRIRTGNMESSTPWVQTDSYLADAKKGDNTLKVDKLWYTFPIGSGFKATVGALIENYYMIETPTRYKPILKALKLGGYGALLGASTGQGFGLQWRQQVDPGEAAFNVASNYVADGGDGADGFSREGMFGENTDAYWLNQIGYGNRKWHISALYALKNAGQSCPDPSYVRKNGACKPAGGGSKSSGVKTGAKAAMGYSTPRAKFLGHPLNAVGLRGYWQPEESGFIPTISAGVDFGFADGNYKWDAKETFGWMVGLGWKDAFLQGNKLGIGFGSYSSYATEVDGTGYPGDDNFAIEGYYDFQVTDNIKVTPAIFWVDKAYGQEGYKSQNKLGGLVKTTFKF